MTRMMHKADPITGRQSLVPYDPELMSFTHNGVMVHNPFMCEGKPVSPEHYGFEDQEIDWVKSCGDHFFCLTEVVLSRYVPSGTVLLLDSSRLSVLPLAGRSFQYTPLARTGDAETGQMIGEYTLECRNETAHGVIRGFTA